MVKKGLLFKQKVALGAEYRSQFEVTKGLQENDVIISRGINVVYPGMKIIINKKKKSKQVE